MLDLLIQLYMALGALWPFVFGVAAVAAGLNSIRSYRKTERLAAQARHSGLPFR